MFLRSLSIRGFKSFAERTTLDFTPGISVIVGPNGSGKSNLVDAISWVLGEQGPRALRGSQMADVIFAGSPQRPQLGMAEVKLVIDNSAGLIPVPMTELDQDVLRLQDVLAELKRQLKPLRQQAEIAKRHEDLTGEADSIAVRLAA